MAERYGIVLLTHGNLGKELMETCALITGPVKGMTSVSVGAKDDVESIRKRIAKAIREMNQGSGVLLLVDMFGGTPSNLAISFLAEGKVEVVTGVNLPMLTRTVHMDSGLSLREAASLLRDYGREHIKAAAEYLET